MRARRRQRRLRAEWVEERIALASDFGQIVGTVSSDLDNGPEADLPSFGQQVELFLDDEDGVFDPGPDGDMSLGTAETGPDGAYAFNNLTAGGYWVRINPSAGSQTRAGESVSSLISFDDVEAQGTEPFVIDDFSTTQEVAASTAGSDNSSDAAVSFDGENAGAGQGRDLFVQIEGGFGEVRLESDFVGTGLLNLAGTGNVTGQAKVTWDGIRFDGSPIDPNGLGLDLLGLGNNGTIVLEAAADRAGALVTVRLFSSTTQVSEATVAIPDTDAAIDGDPTESILIPLASFSPAADLSAVDLTQIAAIEIEFNFTPDDQASLDAQVDSISVIAATTKSADFTVLPTLSVGDRVWLDADNNGLFDPGEVGIPDVVVTLFRDTDGDGSIADEAAIDSTFTDSAGAYGFANLLPGDYAVRVEAENFSPGGALERLVSSTGNDLLGGLAPDPDTDSDDNVDRGNPADDGSVASAVFALVGGVAPSDFDTTIDFGFAGYDLALSKTVDQAVTIPGETLTFTLLVTNEGPATATGVTVTDTLPAGVTFTNATTTFAGGSVVLDPSSGEVIATLGTLPSGATAEVTIEVLVDAVAPTNQSLTNTATVTGVGETGPPLNNTDPVSFSVAPRIDLAIAKSDDDNDLPLAPGDTITYTLLVRNNGPSIASGVMVTDTLPAGVTFVSAGSTTPTTVTPTQGGTALDFSIGVLAPGQTAELTVVGVIDADFVGTLTNSATVSGVEAETTLENNAAASQTVVVVPLGSITGSVYVDLDGDNVQDAEDSPLLGVLLTLFDADGSVIDTTTTDALGSYAFAGLAPGVYRVVQTQPEGFLDLDETSGTPGADVTGDNVISNITVLGGQISPANDFTEGPLPLGTISGVVYNDLNQNGLRDGTLTVTAGAEIVLVIDRSGSMGGTFADAAGGSGTRLEAAIAGVIAFNQQLIDQGLGDAVSIGVVVFDGAAQTLDLNPLDSVVAELIHPAADADADGVLDLVEEVSRLTLGGTTSFAPALESALELLQTGTSDPSSRIVVFLSDGEPGDPGTFPAVVDRLRAAGIEVRAFGVGGDASLEALQAIDPNAAILTDGETLIEVLGGLTSFGFLEPGLAGWTVYLDANGNGRLDDTEAFTQTDSLGAYTFEELAAGIYTVRVQLPTSWRATAPVDGVATTEILLGLEGGPINFGATTRGGFVVNPPIDPLPPINRSEPTRIDLPRSPIFLPRTPLVVPQPSPPVFGSSSLIDDAVEGAGGSDRTRVESPVYRYGRGIDEVDYDLIFEALIDFQRPDLLPIGLGDEAPEEASSEERPTPVDGPSLDASADGPAAPTANPTQPAASETEAAWVAFGREADDQRVNALPEGWLPRLGLLTVGLLGVGDWRRPAGRRRLRKPGKLKKEAD